MTNNALTIPDFLRNQEYLSAETAASESVLNGLLCVGDYEIRAEGNLIFISHSSGESGGFDPASLEKCIDRFFNENF